MSSRRNALLDSFSSGRPPRRSIALGPGKVARAFLFREYLISMDLSDRPTPFKLTYNQLRGWAAVILALAALAKSFVHQPEDAAKTSYLSIVPVVVQMQEDSRKNHDDLVALRGYVEAYTHEHETVIAPVTPPSAPAVLPTLPIPRSASSAVVRALAPPSASPPPPIAPPRPPAKPRSADSITW
jgi:hypothetical protein